MSRVLENIKLELDEELEEKLAWMAPGYSDFRILKQSIDARRRGPPHMVYSVEVYEAGETPSPKLAPLERIKQKAEPVLIIGAGPAGLFAALRLLERGIPCILFEQGSVCEKRLFAINKFWRYGELDKRNNVGFGEGGAGLYSDGKLITRIKSPHIPYVMQKLVEFGAPEEILYLSNPHVGSDRIRRVIPLMRKYLLQLGGDLKFDTKVTKFLSKNNQMIGLETEHGEKFLSPHIILACGHSAEDIFQHLHEIGVHLDGKSFAMGLRIEHPQEVINKIQFREFAEHSKLGPATYRLAAHNKSADVGVYSFCMCPGGYVLSCATDVGGVVSNGMSNYKRNSAFANAAIVVSIDHKKNFGDDLFGGLKFRREVEARALKMVEERNGSKELPVQRLTDFIDGRLGEELKSSCPSGVKAVRLDQLFDSTFNNYLIKGLESFERSMRGFISDQAQFHGVESRTSCPIRITRDDQTLQSISHKGLYPSGEGAGYAGGITSAACDGIKIAEAIALEYEPQLQAADLEK